MLSIPLPEFFVILALGTKMVNLQISLHDLT